MHMQWNSISNKKEKKKKKKSCNLLHHRKSFEKIMLSEVSQRENKKYCMILPICGIYNTDLKIQHTDEENRMVVAGGSMK